MSEPKTSTLTKVFHADTLTDLINSSKRKQVAYVQGIPEFITPPDPITYSALDIPDEDYLISDILPFLRTENFIGEVQNLTVEQIPGSSKLKIGQLVRADKDIFSAVEMGSWYIMKHCNDSYEEEEEDIMSVLRGMIRKPKIR